jgi:hypothetical protein
MSWFSKKQDPQDGAQDYDEQQHEIVEVDGQDTQGHTYHEYIRDKHTQRLIGEVAYQRQIRPLDGRRGRQ